MKITLLLLAACSSACLPVVMAQTDAQKKHFSFRGDISGPFPLRSQAFNKEFGGVYDGSLSLAYSFKGGFTLGLFGKQTMFDNNRTKSINVGVLNARVNSSGLLLAYDIAMGDKYQLTSSLKGGYGLITLLRKNRDLEVIRRHKEYVVLVEPGIDLFMIIEKLEHIGFHIGYSVYTYQYEPEEVGVQAYDGNTKGNTQSLNIGFSIIFDI